MNFIRILKSGEFGLAEFFLHSSQKVANYNIFCTHYEEWRILIGQIYFARVVNNANFDWPTYNYTRVANFYWPNFSYIHHKRWQILIGRIYFKRIMKSKKFWLAEFIFHASWSVANFDWPNFFHTPHERWQSWSGRIFLTCITKGGSMSHLKIRRKYAKFDLHPEGVCHN